MVHEIVSAAEEDRGKPHQKSEEKIGSERHRPAIPPTGRAERKALHGE
jgi:hypothetical protein